MEFILSDTQKKIKHFSKKVCFFLMAMAIVGQGLCMENTPGLLYWEFAETTGTIRRIPQAIPNLYWIWIKWMIRRCAVFAPLIFVLDSWQLQICAITVLSAICISFVEFFGLSNRAKGIYALLTLALIGIFCIWGMPEIGYPGTTHPGVNQLPGDFFPDTRGFGMPEIVRPEMNHSGANRPQLMMAFGIVHPCSSGEEENLPPKAKIIRKRYKIGFSEQNALYEELCINPQIASSALLTCHREIHITVGQLNRIRREWGLQGKKGRLGGISLSTDRRAPCGRAGAALFFRWLEENGKHDPALQTIYSLIEQYKREHPQKKFRLLRSQKKTIERKWKALAALPLLGIGKLTELDYKRHEMKSVLGYSYRSSTLTQFLGQLERIDAGTYMKMVLSDGTTGKYCYIDGHRIAFWTTLKMNKGYITGNGRIMAGSNAVLAHDGSGKAIGLEYYPPDIHLKHIVEEYCTKIVDQTGICNFVIDREVNSVEMAQLFVAKRWNLVCLLDSNEYKGLGSFNKKIAGKLEDGSVLYKGRWKKYRAEDPRKFVIVKESNRTVVYWGTPEIVEQLSAKELVRVYRGRTEIQENSFKRMGNHGKLDTNFGCKKKWGPDRAQMRKLDKIDQEIAKISVKENRIERLLEEQSRKVEESRQRNHGELRRKRERKMAQYSQQRTQIQEELQKKYIEKSELGPAGRRADRDFRKQLIMTFRTLYIENALVDFFLPIANHGEKAIGSEIIVELFFYRGAMVIENDDRIVYQFDDRDLSLKYRLALQNIIEGFNTISLVYNEKPVIAEYVSSSEHRSYSAVG